jgi:hypothetical protein
MATQRELIYTVKSKIRAGLITDDDKISDRQVAFLIDGARATLLRQQINKGQSLSDNNVQTIKCLTLESVDTGFDSAFPLDCKVYKTVQQLPKPIEGKNKDLITGISSTEFGAFTYEFVPYSRIPYMRFTRFKRPFTTLFNSYIYLIDAPYTENISVSGIFEQPNALSEYDDCAGDTCYDWDSNYPMSSHLIDPAVKMVVEELSLTLKVPVDKTNSGNEALEPQSKTQEGGTN